MIPKTQKLLEEEAADDVQISRAEPDSNSIPSTPPLSDVVYIKPLECLNDNVAILRFQVNIEGGLILPDSDKYKEEGIVIGIGPGIPDGVGGRLSSQLKIGDVVTFRKNNIVSEIKPMSGVYKDQVLLILSERSLLMKLPPRQFELITGDA